MMHVVPDRNWPVWVVCEGLLPQDSSTTKVNTVMFAVQHTEVHLPAIENMAILNCTINTHYLYY